MPDQEWMIWSNEHRAWWKPGGWGYTTATAWAGRFTEEHARRICAEANIVPRHDHPPNEIMVLAPDRDRITDDALDYCASLR